MTRSTIPVLFSLNSGTFSWEEGTEFFRKERGIVRSCNGKYVRWMSLSALVSLFQDIKKRLALEQRAKQKAKLRIKGKANAVHRGRKTNMNVIKEYAGWDL